MTLRHMLIFRTVCNNDCNTTKAAEALRLTQPAVSLAIKELEQYYGVCLFDRIGRRLKITDAGRRFLGYAVHITDLFGEMETELLDWGAKGILRVGASITIGTMLLPEYVLAFNRLFPETEVRVTIDQAGRLEKALLANELDFALTEGIVHDPNIVSKAFMDDSLDVIASPASGYRQGQVLSTAEFQRNRFLLREPGSGTRGVFDRVMEEAGIPVEPVWESISTTALINAVSRGLGISVLPHRLVQPALDRGEIITVKVRSLSFSRKFYIAHHRDKYLTDAATAFFKVCRAQEK